MRNFNDMNGCSSVFGLLGKKFLTTTALTAVGLLALSGTAQAADPAWSDFDDVSGTISIDTSTPNTTNINQHSQTYIGNSNNLNIAANQAVVIGQNNRSALFVGRVLKEGVDPTRILGTLKTVLKDDVGDFTDAVGGKVMVIDRNGVLFGSNSRIDVGGIIVSTGNATDEDLSSVTEAGDWDGKVEFSDFGPGQIVNNGNITVADAGIVAFVSPTIRNNGVINAKMGKVIMASGEKVTLDLYGDNLVEIAVNASLANGLIKNSGQINAEGGTVLVTAGFAGDAVNNLINMDGIVDVSSATMKGGKIILLGGNKGSVLVKGKLNADGKAGQDAGSVKIKGKAITVAAGASITADSNGGVGGDAPDLLAPAILGKAGDIRLIANEKLVINAPVSAQGLAGTGFIETSAPEVLFGKFASVLATKEWYLDPTNFKIYNPLALLIEAQLALGDMTIETPDAGPGVGEIGIYTVIDWATTSTLSLIAHADIFFNVDGANKGGINATGGGNFEAVAGDDFRMFAGNESIFTNGGDVKIKAGDEFTLAGGVIDAAGGNIEIDNAGSFEALAESLMTSGTGMISLNQNKPPVVMPTLEAPIEALAVIANPTIQNAIDAIANTGTGTNTVAVGAGTWAESVTIDHENVVLNGANVGLAGNDAGRGAEKVLLHQTHQGF